MRKGTITIGVLLTVIGGTAMAVWGVVTYVNNQISPVAMKADQNTADIASIKEDITWIKSALAAKGFHPNTSSTYEQ